MEDLLLYVASSGDERSFAFHCLEIISLMFREQVCVPHSTYVLVGLGRLLVLFQANLDHAYTLKVGGVFFSWEGTDACIIGWGSKPVKPLHSMTVMLSCENGRITEMLTK